MYDARKEEYEVLEFLDPCVLFTEMRIDRSTVPDGLYSYDLRHDDNGGANIREVCDYVRVNHFGSIICKNPIEMRDGETRFITDEDYSFLGNISTLEDFINGTNKTERKYYNV